MIGKCYNCDKVKLGNITNSDVFKCHDCQSETNIVEREDRQDHSDRGIIEENEEFDNINDLEEIEYL